MRLLGKKIISWLENIVNHTKMKRETFNQNYFHNSGDFDNCKWKKGE